MDPTRTDSRYLSVTLPTDLPPGRELVGANRRALVTEHVPTSGTTWETISAERLGSNPPTADDRQRVELADPEHEC